EPLTAQVFRSWGATEAAFSPPAATACDEATCGTPAAGVCREVCTAVAGLRGNTPNVCRKSYIDPRVFEGWRDGRLHRRAASARGPRQWEAALLGFLSGASRKSGA